MEPCTFTAGRVKPPESLQPAFIIVFNRPVDGIFILTPLDEHLVVEPFSSLQPRVGAYSPACIALTDLMGLEIPPLCLCNEEQAFYSSSKTDPTHPAAVTTITTPGTDHVTRISLFSYSSKQSYNKSNKKKKKFRRKGALDFTTKRSVSL